MFFVLFEEVSFIKFDNLFLVFHVMIWKRICCPLFLFMISYPFTYMQKYTCKCSFQKIFHFFVVILYDFFIDENDLANFFHHYFLTGFFNRARPPCQWVLSVNWYSNPSYTKWSQEKTKNLQKAVIVVFFNDMQGVTYNWQQWEVDVVFASFCACMASLTTWTGGIWKYSSSSGKPGA